MTNKKKTRKNKAPAETGVSAATKEEKEDTTSQPATAAKSGLLSSAQFAVLVLLSLGMSRLMLIASAISDDNDEPTQTCIDYLGDDDDICKSAALNNLLKYKRHTGIQCWLLAMALAMVCWRYEESMLARLNTLFIFSPMITGTAALCASHKYIADNNKIRRELITSLVLSFVVGPSVRNLPFLSGRRQPYKTLQSLCLLTLTLMLASEAVSLAMNLFQHGYLEATETILSTDVDNVHAAATVILYLLLVDKITSALIYAFAWFYLPDSSQRTFLLLIALVKLLEYNFLLPMVKDCLREAAAMEAISLTVAAFGVFCWLAPNLGWKKKIG